MSSASLKMQAWQFEELEAKGESCWKNESIPEKDLLLDEALLEAQKLVTVQFDEEEPAILQDAYIRAERFLRTQSHEMKKRLGFFPAPPSLSPGPNGSADLHWDRSDGGLLVNIPEGNATATFYGEWGGTNRIKGSFNPNTWELGILTWLSKS